MENLGIFNVARRTDQDLAESAFFAPVGRSLTVRFSGPIGPSCSVCFLRRPASHRLLPSSKSLQLPRLDLMQSVSCAIGASVEPVLQDDIE